MKNKRIVIRKIVPFTLLFAALCLFTACHPDPDDNIIGNDMLNTLQKYKWMSGDNVEFNEYDTWVELTNDVFVYYFISDTEGILRHHHKWIDSSTTNNEGRSVDNIFFTYTVSGNSVTIRLESGGGSTLTYDGTNLKGSGDIYHPVTPSAGDWEQIKKLLPVTGKTGDCTYTYYPQNKALRISGTGAMADYASGNQPWKDYKNILSSVYFEEGVTHIGNHAFSDFVALREVDFPLEMNLKSIGIEAFAKTSLTNVKFPPSLETIKESAFVDCKSLTDIAFTYGTQIKTIENRAFGGCNLKQSVFVDNTVETIGMMAFGGNYNFVNVGNHVKSFGAYPFSTSATSGKMYINRGTPPTASQGLTPNDSKWTLYVPTGCKSAYQKASPWKNFKTIIEDSSLEKGDDYTGGNEDNNGSGNGNKKCPDNNHPHLIDLGLPSGTLWACCNVGASKPEDYGGYYAWGETKTKSIYSWGTYQYGNNKDNVVNIGINISGTQYDAATKNWGSSWCMPSSFQIDELWQCSSTWTSQGGVKGRIFKGKNGGTLFLPAAGERFGETWIGGGYWSSSLDEYSPGYAFCLLFDEDMAGWNSSIRACGRSVRPVMR